MKGGAGLEVLVDEVAEIAAWCACVGIPMLSVYEKTGMPQLMLEDTPATAADWR